MRGDNVAIDVLVIDGCPHAEAAFALVRRICDRLAPDAAVARIDVRTPEMAAEIGFLGSPTIRVNGRDIEGRGTGAGALTCRIYDGSGVPPEWMAEAAIVRALLPRSILFLCVENSGRSQMAEGLARSLAPQGARIWSAGSRPQPVRPEAVAVLQEIEIDIAAQRSKAVSEIRAADVDLVITLCAEEECPVFLGKAIRLHWGLPDPAAVLESEEARLAAFRGVRNELGRRIAALFSE